MAMVKCPTCGHEREDAAPQPAYDFAFFIARKTPSQNDNTANFGGVRWAYQRQRGWWCAEFRAARLDGRVTRATGKRRVVFVRIMGPREKPRDYGNLVGGMKLVVDAMRMECLLIDDSPKWLEDEYRQEPGPVTGLRVEVTQLDDSGAGAP